MGIGDWIQDGLDATSNAFNTVDRYINPFHLEVTWKDGHATHHPGRDAPLAPAVRPVSGGLERVMQGLNWVYDNGVSQPLSTALLVGGQSWNDVLSGREWARAWHAANHISPGQALWLGETKGEAGIEAAIDSPLVYATPPRASLPADWDELPEAERQRRLKEAGMPAIGNAYIEKLRRDSDFFKYASGTVDFGVRWWADPAILAGKALGAGRRAAIVRPRPRGGWSKGDIDKILDSSVMTKAQRFLWENKDNSQLLNNLSMARQSAMGPRFGGIVSKLQSPDEVTDFLRVTMGDIEARAALMDRNAAAANRIEKDTARLAELDLARTHYDDVPFIAHMVRERMDEVERQINADTDLVERYRGMLEHYGELDALNTTRFSFARAERRTAAQREYKAGPARISKSRVYSDLFGTPITVVRALREAHPNGYVKIDDIHPESLDELRAHIARIPGIGPDIRQDILNRYLKTGTEGERLDILDEVGRLGVRQIAKKHGLTNDQAMALYNEHRKRVGAAQEGLRRYSAATGPDGIHVDEFMAEGGKLVVHPNMVTRLANDHVLMDLKALDTTLKRHGSALRVHSGSARDWLEGRADWFNSLWKFGTLFRLGYIPRVLGDDLLGQVARLGAGTMALRTGYGVKNLATNLASWRAGSHFDAIEAVAREGLRYADEEIAALTPAAKKLRIKIASREAIHKATLATATRYRTAAEEKLAGLPADAPAARRAALGKLVAKHGGAAKRAERALRAGTPAWRARLAEHEDQLAELGRGREEALAQIERVKTTRGRGFRQSSQLHREVQLADGVVLPPALGGQRGEYFQRMISSDESLGNLFRSNKRLVHNNLLRSYSHSGVSMSYAQDPRLFVSSWHQAINNQIMQDALAVRAVRGESAEQMEKWLTSTPEGRTYRKRLGLKHVPNARIAESVWHDVAEYLPTAEVRDAALRGQADRDYLAKAAEKGLRPHEVHTTQLAENLAGQNRLSQGMDRVIDAWFKSMTSIPADRMARHPLFNQLYEDHARALATQELKQGAKIAQADADRLAETARRLAMRDTRKLVFDIAHRSDVAHALRFISPFFAATTEAWQRWARIIADKPQVVGYSHNFFNAPASWGWMQDQDGNRIQSDGTVVGIGPDGRAVRRFVPKGERFIMARVPGFIADGPVGKALGMDSSGRWLVSQDSMNLITQGDPWFNPGTGPIVSIPVNEFVKDKPEAAELARHLGVLPFGPQTGGSLLGDGPLGRVAQQVLPPTIKNFLTAFDTSDERYQRVKLVITQRAAYEHANLGKRMPTAKEIAAMTRDYWLFSASSAFLQPFATQKPDRYQFFRDQYNALRRKNPLTADEEYLRRFGESHFIFAQATSDSAGIPATKRAVALSKEYADLIATNPDLAPLIVGPEGNGPFSPEAYAYQLTTPLVPGGAEMQRRKLSADEAMAENQRRLGWAKFTAKMNEITAELHRSGFQSFSDPGAEELADRKRSYIALYSEPLYPDGTVNPYYNEEWSKDFYSFDARKYERLIPALTAVARSRLADEPSRSDLRVLQEYLGARQALLRELAARGTAGGAKTLRAQANGDLARRWAQYVDSLIERDTRFGDLHHHYLSRDMGVDVEDMLAEEEEAA
ncbi:hypothetical protein ACZ90_00335 [Streptomyces albus subsp. albus]|nr:hypothetical protein ACZ90_00335 [Streptomyces albus subsp. albus]